ncbi:hypothetical protein [Rhodococcus erythropolis]|uniref:hypothetical protein n=1 Tax=Rhodococcus erythropolis TaxID=1833 RepID=UPI0018AFCCE1|nr:hypothetical protein [Rhodococcus erythropolis]
MAITLGVVLVVGMLVFGGALLYSKSQVDDLKEAIESSDASRVTADLGEDAAPALIGDYNRDGVVTSKEYDMMPPTEYATLSDKVRVEDSAKNINTYLPSAFSTLQSNGSLSAKERALVSLPNLNAPRSQWSDQDYYNNYTLGVWLASTQGQDQASIDEGQRALTVVLDPNNDGFIKASEMISSVSAIKNIYEAQPFEFSNQELKPGTSIGGISIDGSGGRLVKGESLSSGEVKYHLFVNRTDSNGNVVSTLIRSYSSPLDPDLKTAF